MSNRGQHQEFRRRQSQVRLLGPRSLRAVAAGRGHYQDSLQKRPQWMVEGGSLRPGEGSANGRRPESCRSKNITHVGCGVLNVNCLCFPGGLLSVKLCGWGQFRVLLMHWLRCVHTLYLYTYNILYNGRGQLHYCLSAYEGWWACDWSEVVWIKKNVFPIWLFNVHKWLFVKLEMIHFNESTWAASPTWLKTLPKWRPQFFYSSNSLFCLYE